VYLYLYRYVHSVLFYREISIFIGASKPNGENSGRASQDKNKGKLDLRTYFKGALSRICTLSVKRKVIQV